MSGLLNQTYTTTDGHPFMEKPYEPEKNWTGVPCGPLGGTACGMKAVDRSFYIPDDLDERARLEKQVARENYAALQSRCWNSGKRGFGKFDWRHGHVKWDNDDIYVGELTIEQNCNGKGVMYKYVSGEAYCGTWEGKLWKYPALKGEGVSFSKDRSTAEKLMDGKPTGTKISIEEALAMLETPDAAKIVHANLPESQGILPGSSQTFPNLQQVPHVYSKSYMKELRDGLKQQKIDKAAFDKTHVKRWHQDWAGPPVDMTPKEINPVQLDKAMNQIRHQAYPI